MMPKPPKTDNVKTLVVDKFNGRLTRFRDGDINSGFANFYKSWGYDAFQLSGTLSFSEGATDIKKGVVTDLIMAGKSRAEGNISFLYAIGHTGKLYKVQVNDPTTKNPDYDTPVLLATLSSGQTFKYGASLDFYQGLSEKIWIGHDTGITKINLDGTGETNLASGWTNNVPREQAQFVGKLLFTDGANLAYVDGTETVITHTALSPGFPANSQARDLDITPDGRYLVTTVTRNTIGDMTSVSPNISDIASMPSLIAYWNGSDTTVSSFISFPSFSMTAYQTFGSFEYVFGYQIGGAMLGTPKKTLLVDEFTNPPLPNAIGSSGDFLSWGSTTFDLTTGHTNAMVSIYGTIDQETPVGLYRQLIKTSTLSGGDVVRVPFYTSVSSFVNAGSVSGYTAPPFNLVGTGKTYFSTIEYDGSTTSYGFWRFKNVISYLDSTNSGVYETQHQPFSGKIKPTEVRIYYEAPGALAGGVSFKTDLIGIDGSVLTGGTATHTPTTTQDISTYNPNVGATSYIGLRITNAGSYTPYIHRVEIDYTPFGQT